MKCAQLCLIHLTLAVEAFDLYYTTVDGYSIDSQWSRYRPSVGGYIDRHSTDVSVDLSTDTRPTSRSIGRPTYLGRYIGRVSVDRSTDISVECWSICRPIYRSRGAQNTHDPSISRTINPRKLLICYVAIFELLRCLISAFIDKQTNSDFKNSGRNRKHNRPVKNFKIALFCFSTQSRSYALKRRCIRK